MTRQANYAWPNMLLPCINRLRWYGVLPDPKGPLWAEWPSLVEENRVTEVTRRIRRRLRCRRRG